MSDYNSKTVIITNKSITATIDFITQTYAGVTINGKSYNLTLGVPVEIDPPGFVYHALLTHITYLTTTTAMHSVDIRIYSNAIPGASTTTIPVAKPTPQVQANSTLNTVPATTTILATTAVPIIVSNPPIGNGSGTWWWIIVGSVIVIIVVVLGGALYWLSHRRPRRWK